VFGVPGVGKTALALMLGYMAARARAAVLFSSVGLDETEIMARLAARALHREYHNVEATYGTIWSGVSMQEPALRGPISASIETVVKKVGEQLYLHSADPMDDVSMLAEQAAHLSNRNDRVVVIVDGAEAYSAGGSSASLVQAAGYEARLSLVAHELSKLARQGCVVITTCHTATAELVAPAATVAAELRTMRDPAPRGSMKKKLAVDAKPMDLAIVKNRLGPTGTVPLLYVPAASVFEERKP
jgi:replicative DNA helicase